MASPCWSEAGSSIQTCQWSSSQRYMIFRSPYSLCAMALTTTCSSRSSASNCWLQFAELSIIAASNEKTNPTSRFSRPARHKLALARGSAQQQGLPQWSRTQILFAAKSRLPLRMVEHEKEHHHGKRPNASIRLQMGGSSPSAKRGAEKKGRACSSVFPLPPGPEDQPTRHLIRLEPIPSALRPPPNPRRPPHG